MRDAHIESEKARLRSATIWLTLGLWAFAGVTFAGSIQLGGRMALSAPVVVWLGLGTLSGMSLSLVLHQLVRRVQLRCARARWTLLICAAVVLAGAQAVVDGALHTVVNRAFGLPTDGWFNPAHFGMNSLIYMGLFGFYAATLELIAMTERAAAHARESALYAAQAAEARELAREAQVRLLQLQMNPHFLFNTLNSISSLVGAGRFADADRMIARLSDFLRVSLQSTAEGVSPLGRELEALEAYLEIESVRFSDTLNLQIDCPEALHAAPTPTLILQPLLEAAIHHAHASPDGSRKMRLIIRQDDDRLVIRAIDTSLTATRAPGVESDGLETVRRRLEVIYGPAASMHVAAPADGFRIEISLPIARDPRPRT
ncbi:sensor histidine kinase [Brevundimonas kwangchunensis]|uniref:sensor histidine kinase n=1 Tax=Brevundimonas kwangchunensis TaxID=322163 RepID=UPI0031E08D6E